MSLYRPRSIPSIYATGLVVGASLICYGNSLFNGFVFDDPAYINHPVIRQFLLAEAFLEPWRGLNLYRPLTLVSLAFDYLLYGEVPAGFHLTHILLHAANCLVLHRIALKLLDRPGAALLAGLFYALHPLQGDVVNWLSARGDLLMGLFLGLGFWCHLQARLSPAPSLWRWGAWALYGASLLAKETGIVLMGIVWCYDACQDAPRPPSPTALARFSLNWLKRHWGYVGVLLGVLALRSYVLVGAEGGPAAANFLAALEPAERGLSIVAIFSRYLYLMLVPLNLSPTIPAPPSPPPPPSLTPGSWAAWSALVCCYTCPGAGEAPSSSLSSLFLSSPCCRPPTSSSWPPAPWPSATCSWPSNRLP